MYFQEILHPKEYCLLKPISNYFTFFFQEVVTFKNSCIFARATIVNNNWPVRLSARTPGFHPGKRGSIPLRATKFKILWLTISPL